MKNELRKNTFSWNNIEKQLNYLLVPALFSASVNMSDDKGVVWCNYCYKDNVPVFTVYLRDVEILTLCQNCIGKIFAQYELELDKKEKEKQKGTPTITSFGDK